MDKIKIIKINDTKIHPKKQLYNDILSSSKKIEEIIKKSKSKKNFLFKTPNKEATIKQIYKEPTLKQINNEIETTIKPKKKRFKEPVNKPKKTLVNVKNYFKYEKHPIVKKTITKIDNLKNKSKKNIYKESTILNYFNNKKKIKLFTKPQIKKFIKVLNSKKSEINYIHKYIKKLNKYQTIQILYALKIITKKSNAPIKILKNILLNYFTSDIVIIK